MVKKTKLNEERKMQIVEDEVDPMKEEELRDLNPITEICNYSNFWLDTKINALCELSTDIFKQNLRSLIHGLESTKRFGANILRLKKNEGQ